MENHAVLYDGIAWRLSPAYDLNPVPAHVKPRELATAINVDGDATASIELALRAAPEFFLKENDARAIAAAVHVALKDWRLVAAECGVPRDEIERMTTAFEHADAAIAGAWR